LTANWRKENPNIEPAFELLKRIQKEKEQIVKEKKIRKEKPLLKIAKDEIPYNIPEYWTWCRVGESGFTQTGSTPPKKNPENYGNFIPFIGPADISNHLMKYPVEGLSELGISVGRLIPKDSLMMVCIGGSIGKCNINEIDVSCNQQINTVTPILIPAIYIKTVCQSPFFQRNVLDKSSGSATPIINKGKWEAIPIPLPPLEEQKEIVKVVETLFKEVEQLEQLTVARIGLKEDFVTSALNQLTTNNANQEWIFLQEHFKSFFNETSNIKKLRETVLQLAVQGKLTADWRANHPETEDASVLLKRIQKEKAQLVKDKKIRKEKIFDTIKKEELLHNLPETWVWCRLADITILITDGKHGNCQDEINSGYYFLSAKDVQKGKLLYGNARQINYKEFAEVHQRTNLEAGDLCIVNTGATVGKSAIVEDNEYTRKTTFQKSVAVVKVLHEFVDINYLDNFIINQTPKLLKKSGGSAINNLLLGDMKKIITPLPPLDEQKAIVQKVNALMGLCDKLELEVQQSQEHSEQLMQSCLREVFEGKSKMEEV
jgi:type I restriction enzyme S subunit